MSKLNLMMIVTKRKLLEPFSELLTLHQVPLVLTEFGRGTASPAMLDYLGLMETEKAVMFSLIGEPAIEPLIKDLKRKLYIDLPDNGIVITVPLHSIGGSQSMKVLTEGLEGAGDKSMDEKKQIENYKQQLIVVIANEGHTDIVMDAARSMNAGGGTVVHAKGTGNAGVKKFFGLSIAEEKEMIFIVTKAEDRANIMRAIMQQAGHGTSANSIVFSLPVSSVAGLTAFEEE